MQKKWTPGKIVALVFGSIGAGLALLVSLYIGIIQLSADLLFFDNRLEEDTYGENGQGNDGWYADNDMGGGKEDSPGGNGGNGADQDDIWGNGAGTEEEKSDGQYYDFHDEIKSGLSYQIEVKQISDPVDNNDHTFVVGSFPVVTCEDKNKENRINDAIQEEIKVVSEHVASVGEGLPEDVYFIFEMESYVTYMDEDILSVIYEEYAYLDDEMYESYVVSVNLDMESGMPMTNSQILDIDDEFSIDFRERNEKQNGPVQGLDYYSDQDITEMLNDDDSLIIFYTPLGMEIGINYYFGWVTVTYTDYTKFSNPF